MYRIFSENKNNWPKEITNRLKILFPNIERISIVPTPGGSVMLEVVENGTKFFSQSLSDGFFKIIAILALSFKISESNLLVVEEIENSIHPEAIEILIDALKNSGKQVIITTHSPIVLNICEVEDILFVKKDNREGTKLILLEEHGEIESIKNFLKNEGRISDYLESRL